MHLVVSAAAIAVIATSAAGSAKHALHLLEAHALNDDDARACYHGVEEPLDEKEEASDEVLKCQWMSYRSPVMPRWMGWGSGEDVILFGLHRLGMLAHHSAAAHHGTAPIDHSDLIRARVLERHEGVCVDKEPLPCAQILVHDGPCPITMRHVRKRRKIRVIDEPRDQSARPATDKTLKHPGNLSQTDRRRTETHSRSLFSFVPAAFRNAQPLLFNLFRKKPCPPKQPTPTLRTILSEMSAFMSKLARNACFLMVNP